MPTPPKILIVGAGPTGLGAAWRLNELGYDRWQLVDAAESAGGLAASFVDDSGFTWDLGGHVIFSHYEYFDRLLDHLLGDAWVEHVRESWVWMRDRFIPYPLQNNIWRLPEEELIACLRGLLSLQRQDSSTPPETFLDWILTHFGRGLADVFLVPYNRKVWAYEPEQLDVGWMGERVAKVDLARILENLVRRHDDAGWGPNARFRYPLDGGNGAIWKALFQTLPEERVRLRRRLQKVHSAEKRVEYSDGTREGYDRLISTVPLDRLLQMFTDRPDLAARATAFRYSSTHVVGIGLEGEVPSHLNTKCWLYFPEPEIPFYRATVFSNYSPHNVPEPGRQWSLLCEVSESPQKPVDTARIVEQVIAGLERARLLAPCSRITSRWHRRLEHGYPTPFLGRDDVLREVDPQLRERGIWSRGRFGAWKYEVANQDHSLMQGVEAVDHLLFGAEETTYHHPGVVNHGKSTGRTPAFERAASQVAAIALRGPHWHASPRAAEERVAGSSGVDSEEPMPGNA